MEVFTWDGMLGLGQPMYHIAFSGITGGKMELIHHGHQDFGEIFWVTDGCGVHHVNGDDLPLSKDHLVVILPGDEHSITAAVGQGLSYLNLALPEYLIEDYNRRYALAEGNLFKKCELGNRVTILNPDQKFELDESVQQLFSSPHLRVYVDRFICNLFCSLEQQLRDAEYPVMPDWLKKACDEIKKPEHFVHGTKAFFNLALRSKEHVTRKMKLLTGRTPSEYVHEIRLSHAARCLLLTDKPIEDISHESGFHNIGVFYLYFKKFYGMSPRQYRIQNRKLVPNNSAQ